MSDRPVLFTIGHSTRALEQFIALLRRHAIGAIADVRTLPRSRRHPHFSGDSLPGHLRVAGIVYRHFPELGGLRRPRPDSPNVGWRNTSFRGYADHMQTPAFERGLQALLGFAQGQSTAVMCAEAVWWRCHRRLLADAALLRGYDVRHIVSADEADRHKLCEFAQTSGTTIIYREDTRVLFGGRWEPNFPARGLKE